MIVGMGSYPMPGICPGCDSVGDGIAPHILKYRRNFFMTSKQKLLYLLDAYSQKNIPHGTLPLTMFNCFTMIKTVHYHLRKKR